MQTWRMVRIGVDESLAPRAIDRISARSGDRPHSHPPDVLDVDFWIIVFARRSAEKTFQHLRGVKVVQTMMAGVDWITPWLPEGCRCSAMVAELHDISTSEWVRPRSSPNQTLPLLSRHADTSRVERTGIDSKRFHGCRRSTGRTVRSPSATISQAAPC